MGLKYYDDTNGVPVTDLMRQDRIKTDNQLMAFSYYSWKDCPGTSISTGVYIVFYKGSKIDHVTHVLVPVAQSSADHWVHLKIGRC